jgi:DNA recombination-dependent growth factor C
MGILSASVSITRYRVEGRLSGPVAETVAAGLKKHAIADIDDDAADSAVGWTSFTQPFSPDFEGSGFIFNSLFVMALRIDRKPIPAKLFKKHFTLESEKRMLQTGRRFLSKDEKQALKDKVLTGLRRKIPATPHVYDLIWNYEESYLWFFTNLKSANEELETLFRSSFDLSLIRIFPYTAAMLNAGLTDKEKDLLAKVAPMRYH